MRVKQTSNIENVGNSSAVANLTDVNLITGLSGTGNFKVKDSYLNVINWKIKVGSNSGKAEFDNSTINGTIASIDGKDEIKVSNILGSPNLAIYCASLLSPNLNAFSGSKTNNCTVARALTCSGIPISDADNDGVNDNLDDFPTDQYRAFKTPFPSTGYATLMFEDLWPFKGDYDFNDLVVDYKYESVTNGLNQVVEVNYTFVLKAIGAGLNSGFGFQLDNVSPNKITSVSANSKTHNASWLTLNQNGTEAGQTFANVIIFDNVYKSLQWPGVGSMVNVNLSGAGANPYVTPDTTRITLTFLNNGVAPSGGTLLASALPTSAFNPYLIVGDTNKGQIREKEIHLATRIPSSKASTSYFGTGSDDTKPAQGKYYKTAENLPWAIEIFEAIPHMQEKIDISEGYKNFLIWAETNGNSFANWYQNLSGNRNNDNLYIR